MGKRKMDWLSVWRRLSPRRMIEPDVRDEIAFHIEGRVRELVESGCSEEEARAHVLERFGDVESVREACRAYDTQRVNGYNWRMTMEAWVRDARFALRSMRRNWGFTTVVVLTLAVGVGASTAVFSVVEGILLRPLPFPAPDELAVVWQNDRATGTVRENASTSDYYDYLDRNRTFDDLAIYGLGTAVLLRPGAAPVQLEAASVSRNLAPILGVEMQLGRNFTAAEDVPGGPAVVVLTHRVWTEVLGADPEIVGSTLTIDDRPAEVIGVLPAGLDYPAGETDVWTPIQQSPATATRPNHWVRVVGRLQAGVTVASAQADMSRIMADLEVEYAGDNQNRGAFVEGLSDVGRGDLRSTLWVLFASVLAVLAIACVNVANLLLARGASRSRELAVLKAVGAGEGHIRRKFFVEGALITVLAAAAGIALASGGIRLLTVLAPPSLLLLGEPAMNLEVLSFAIGLGVLICVGFGLLPALQFRGLDLQRQLKDGRTTEGGTAGLALRRVLVAGQLSLAVVLLLGATLLMGTVKNIQSIDPGFRAENSLRVDFALPARYTESMATYPNWPAVHQFIAELTAETEAVPGVESAAVVLNHPLEAGFTNSFRIEGQAYDPSQGEMTTRLVTPSYFEAAGLSLVTGRLLDDGDRVGEPDVIVLNESAANRYFPEGDAIGSRIAFWGPGFREIVGIVGNERIHGLTADTPPAMYVSLFQAPPLGGKITLMARTRIAPLSVVEGVRAAMRSVDPDVPVFNVATMEATLANAMARERFASTVLSLFAGIALFLAILGVHGVLAYLVAQRGHEVGVRMALGATRGDVVRMVVKEGASMTVFGIVLGLVVAFGASGLIQGLLYGVSATAPLAYFGVATALGAVALAATAVPALRAASIDPVSSLRGD
jgi:putative ABC transport system permease protein